jgi:hypothetical protein
MTNSNTAQSKQAQAPKQPGKPGPEYRRLDVFVGKWKMEGLQYDGPFGPAAKVSAVETYEWLTGGFFLVHRLDGRLGDAEIACIEVIGQDASSQSYPRQSFYSDGKTNIWRTQEDNGTWTLTGDAPMEDKSLKVRSTTAFSDSGNKMTAKWEYSSDGSRWQTFWDVDATKID